MPTVPPSLADNAGVPALGDPRLQDAYDYWLRKCAGRALPSRRDLDPLDIPKLLPHVLLVEVHDGGRYRYRVVGTENVTEHGIDATGRYADEVIPGPEYKAHVLQLYAKCVRERRPVYSESLFLSPIGLQTERHLKVLFLPLSADGNAVNMVLVVQLFFYVADTVRRRHFLDAPPHREIVHATL
jgi:hypothetical protein